METSNSYCSLFWNHVSIRPGNRLQPCCRFESRNEELEIFDGHIATTLNSPFFTELRTNALQGKKNPGCRKCYELEDLGLRSPRMKNNSKDKTAYNSPRISLSQVKVLDLFVGDICNLKCIMCNPTLSTSWRQEYQKLGWDLAPRAQYSPKNLEDSLHLFEQLEEVRFIGGEPLLMPQHQTALDRLKPKSNEIQLTYSTNGTVLPSPEILKDWQDFKQINIYLSVDGVGKTNDYVRFPSNWSELDSNIGQFLQHSQSNPKLKIDFLCTVSLFNVWNIAELENWYKDKTKNFSGAHPPELYLNPLVDPDFMSLNNLNLSEREKAIGGLTESSALQSKIIRWIEGAEPIEKKAQLKDFIEKVDRVRNIDVRNYIPESKELLGPKATAAQNERSRYL